MKPVLVIAGLLSWTLAGTAVRYGQNQPVAGSAPGVITTDRPAITGAMGSGVSSLEWVTLQ